jgi:hypothetical protein
MEGEWKALEVQMRNSWEERNYQTIRGCNKGREEGNKKKIGGRERERKKERLLCSSDHM